MRTSRCTPDSVFAQPCALWPLMSSVPDLMPASSPCGLVDDVDLELVTLAPSGYTSASACAPSPGFPCRPRPNALRDRCRCRRPRPRTARRSGGGWRRPAGISARRGLPPSVSASPSLSPSSTSVIASSRSRSNFVSEPRRSSSSLRSRMIFCAASASDHRPGSSTRAFSSARRRVAVSTSKMPPQQSERLLDFGDKGFGFGAHEASSVLS